MVRPTFKASVAPADPDAKGNSDRGVQEVQRLQAKVRVRFKVGKADPAAIAKVRVTLLSVMTTQTYRCAKSIINADLKERLLAAGGGSAIPQAGGSP
jgi:hypothetical protein